MKQVNLKNKGFSILEVLIYVTILTFALIFVFLSITYVSRSFKTLKSDRALTTSSVSAMDRMVREIRRSELVDASSVLDTSPGRLVLQPGNLTFYVEDGKLKLQEGTEVLGSLTFPDAEVTNLIFRKITTTESEAIKIELALQTEVGDSVKSKNFYSTAVLRNSY